ncbi:hypothetical protein ACKLTP_13810, partial [Paenarthrobacter ureafaciens]
MSQAAARFLEAYDAQLRTDAEIPGALTVHGHGPLVLATFVGGRGFITYRDLPSQGLHSSGAGIGSSSTAAMALVSL